MFKKTLTLVFCMLFLFVSAASASKPGIFKLTYQEFGKFLKPANFQVVATANEGKVTPIYSTSSKADTIVTGRSYGDPVVSKGYFDIDDRMIGYSFNYASAKSMETVQEYAETFGLSKIVPEIVEKWMVGPSAREDFGLRFVDKKNGLIHELRVQGDPKQWRKGKVMTYGAFLATAFAYSKPTKDYTVRLFVDGEELSYDDSPAPFYDTQDKQVYVALGTVLKQMPGIDFAYDPKIKRTNVFPVPFEYRGVTITPEYKKLSLSSAAIYIDGAKQASAKGMRSVDQSTYMSLANVEKLFRIKGSYDAKSKKIRLDRSAIWEQLDRLADAALEQQKAEKEKQEQLEREEQEKQREAELAEQRRLEEAAEKERQAEADKALQERLALERIEQTKRSFSALMDAFMADFTSRYASMPLADRAGLQSELQARYLDPIRAFDGQVNWRAYGYFVEAVNMVMTQNDSLMNVIADRIGFARSWLEEE